MGDSPAKRLDFVSANKENISTDAVATQIDAMKPVDLVKPMEAVKPIEASIEGKKKKKKVAVASSLKEDESDEPLLQENPHRFVLFPIKYHEVSTRVATRHSSQAAALS